MRRRSLVVLAAVCVGLLGVYALGGWARVVVHLAVNQVCVGVSGGKIGFALLFVAGFALRGAWLNGREAGARGLRAFVAFAVVGLAGSLLSHVMYVERFGLGVGDVGFHWRHGVNSVNSLTHIHTSKVPIAMVVGALGLDECDPA